MENTIIGSLDYYALTLQSYHKGAGQFHKPFLFELYVSKPLHKEDSLDLPYILSKAKMIIIIITEQ